MELEARVGAKAEKGAGIEAGVGAQAEKRTGQYCEHQIYGEKTMSESWIHVNKRLPEGQRPVIVCVTDVRGDIGSARRLRATYYKQYELVCGEYVDDFGEEGPDGELYCPAGWYENNEFEDTHWAISGVVTHWMPLPDFPAEYGSKEI